MARICPFCPNIADSDEHGTAQWITERFLARDKGLGNFTMSFGDLYPERTAKTLNQKIQVCRECNNGWMSSLEGRIKPALVAMSEGSTLHIGLDGQKTIARWLVKSCITAELTTPKQSLIRVSTRDQRYEIGKGRTPAGWRVAIGAYEGEGANLEHRFSNVKQLISDTGESLGYVILHTIRFERFVGQVLIHSMSTIPHLVELLGGSEFGIEIPQREIIFWPPPAILNEQRFGIVSSLGSTS